MEAAGIAPASRDPLSRTSTCLDLILVFVLKTPLVGLLFGLSPHGFRSCCKGWLGMIGPVIGNTCIHPTGKMSTGASSALLGSASEGTNWSVRR
jgi:hypothetical protein